MGKQPQCSDKICLTNRVHLYVRAQITAALDVTRACNDIFRKRTFSVLASTEGSNIGQVIHAGTISIVPLRKVDTSHTPRPQEKLKNVRPDHPSRRSSANDL